MDRFASLAWLAVVLCLSAAAPACADDQAINDLKGRIFDAKMAQQTLAKGLKFCGELDPSWTYRES